MTNTDTHSEVSTFSSVTHDIATVTDRKLFVDAEYASVRQTIAGGALSRFQMIQMIVTHGVV